MAGQGVAARAAQGAGKRPVFQVHPLRTFVARVQTPLEDWFKATDQERASVVNNLVLQATHKVLTEYPGHLFQLDAFTDAPDGREMVLEGRAPVVTAEVRVTVYRRVPRPQDN